MFMVRIAAANGSGGRGEDDSCLLVVVEIVDAVEKQEENSGDEREATAGDGHPVAPGQVSVLVLEGRGAVVAIGESAKHRQRRRLYYNCTHKHTHTHTHTHTSIIV